MHPHIISSAKRFIFFLYCNSMFMLLGWALQYWERHVYAIDGLCYSNDLCSIKKYINLKTKLK